MIEVKVLGPGCPRCNQLYAEARKAVSESGIEATVDKITDFQEIQSFGILLTPGLVINGKVVSSGKVPKSGEIAEQLRHAVDK
jgi:small redox-active disulfide protein 2